MEGKSVPSLFHISGYSIYFWTNEGRPIEPIHVHVAKGRPTPNATKIWISKDGKCVLCNNNSNVSDSDLSKIMKSVETNIEFVEAEWQAIFGEISYHC